MLIFDHEFDFRGLARLSGHTLRRRGGDFHGTVGLQLLLFGGEATLRFSSDFRKAAAALRRNGGSDCSFYQRRRNTDELDPR